MEAWNQEGWNLASHIVQGGQCISRTIWGAIQYLIDHEEDWKRNPEKTLENLRDWWYKEDWRERGKPNLLKLVNKIIDLYKNEMFVRLTINFFVGNIILNKDKWQSPEGCYDPKYWYPRGKGQINYIVHGRRS